jgi:hypothetical protein
MTYERPIVDARPPAEAIDEMVARVLTLAETWTTWDGIPRQSDNRVYTPHKAIRRVTDHMIDHLAQLEAHLAGVPSLQDPWHGSASTTAADMAPFEQADLDEARSRLKRLAAMWGIRIGTMSEQDLDRAEADAYTPREMAFCAVGSIFYADAVGDLASANAKPKEATPAVHG